MIATTPQQPVEVIDDVVRAACLLKPVRLDLLDALREPDSAAGLARRLDVPRQRLNHHLKELERAEFVELVEERRRGNCTERVFRATAERYLIAPQVLGDLAPRSPEELPERLSWARLMTLAGKMLRELTALRPRAERDRKHLATFSVHARVALPSPRHLARLRELLAQAVSDALAEVHDESNGSRPYELVLGVYPSLEESFEAGSASLAESS